MAPRSKPSGGSPGHETKSPKRETSRPAPPADVEPRRKDPRGVPPPDDAPGVPPVERSEDFARKDIETADEPVEEHDRRHHGRDAESGQSR